MKLHVQVHDLPNEIMICKHLVPTSYARLVPTRYLCDSFRALDFIIHTEILKELGKA
jgi:hypothetical protein